MREEVSAEIRIDHERLLTQLFGRDCSEVYYKLTIKTHHSPDDQGYSYSLIFAVI